MISTISESLPLARELIEKKTQDKIIHVRNINSGKHYLMKTEKGLIYYLMYKREFFNSFGAIFGLKGVGESINEEYLKIAIDGDVDSFLISYSTGAFYTISPREWLRFAQSNNTIRVQKNGIEKTYSIPISMLRRWK